jgi:AcrR family transcriptional regulator
MSDAAEVPMTESRPLRSPKITEKRERLAELVIEIAEREITDKGLAGFNARSVAAEAGCSVGTLYNLFENLDGIVIGVNSRTLHRLDEVLTEAERPASSPQDRLLALANAYLDFVVRNRKIWYALFEHRMSGGMPLPDWHLQEHEFLFRHVVEPLSELAPGDSEDNRMLARSIWSAVHGIVSLGLEDRMSVVPPERIREQLEIVVSSFVVGYELRQRQEPA